MTPPAFATPDLLPSYSRPGDSMKQEVELLQRHIQRCGLETDRWSNLRSAAVTTHHFFASRFATTLTLMLVVIVSVSMAV